MNIKLGTKVTVIKDDLTYDFVATELSEDRDGIVTVTFEEDPDRGKVAQ